MISRTSVLPYRGQAYNIREIGKTLNVATLLEGGVRRALAQARLSHLESWMFYAIEPLPAPAQKARAAAEEALRQQPDPPESHLAKGYVHYYIPADAGEIRRSEIAAGILQRPPKNLVSPSVRVCN